MRLKATILLLVTIVWVGSAMATGAYQATNGTFPGEDRIDLEDPRIGDEVAKEFAREIGGDCGAEVCAEEPPVVFMPYGCEGTSQNPHQSSTERTEITAKSFTTCAVKIRRVSATNQL
jgi:hypothetical protein